jgi:hypothetical protein
MKKVIRLTESDLIRIVKRVISEQTSDNISDIINNVISRQVRYSSSFIRTPQDAEKFLNWIPAGVGLQETIEKMFEVKCRTSAEIENTETPGEYGYAGKCNAISRFIIYLLNYYLIAGKNPTTLPFETAVQTSNLTNLYKDIVKGKDRSGKEYNYGVYGGVYVSPLKLENEFKKIYNKQLALFT